MPTLQDEPTAVRTASARLRLPTSAPAHIASSARALANVDSPIDTVWAAMRYQSPLRYPGAKASLGPVVSRLIKTATPRLGKPSLFVEPFCGGAATALRLASSGIVERILLADADPLVARFWQVAASDTEWLIDRMHDEPVTLERWDYWRSWMPKDSDDREIAIKCLFLNRTTFSGILHGRAGPIGGRSQQGAYRIDCRFNKPALEDRIRLIGSLYATNRLVDVWCMDWESTLGDVAERYPQLLPDRVLAYLDPPYFDKSPKLYGRSFDPAGGYKPPPQLPPPVAVDWSAAGWQHYRLAEYLRRRATYRWILSYDSEPRLLSEPGLYAAARMTPDPHEKAVLGAKEWRISKRIVTLRYSVSGSATRADAEELVLTTLPPNCVPRDQSLRPVNG